MRNRYENPLCERYASRRMQEIFSPDRKFSTWRKLWVALAESQKELGLDISDRQIEAMKDHIYDINYDVAEEREQEVRHDVMAHIYAYGVQCPEARPIIHLGATSSYVGDNTDLILMREALLLIRESLAGVILALARFALKYKSLPMLAYTHFQPAQPTTLGKRAAMWLQDLVSDMETLELVMPQIKLLGCRGATGTAASFLELFDGDSEKVARLERLIAQKLGFDTVFDVSGQTYPRKLDYNVLSCLSGIAQSAWKFSNDIRLMSHLKEVDEPFEEKQVGSSAMAYKRNPMRSERISSLSRHVISLAQGAAMTASTQWLERTLDDSAARRIYIPEAFLAVDGILSLYRNVIGNMKVYPAMMNKHLEDELPFLATENILMHCVKKGGDRQVLHEAIREIAVSAARDIKETGAKNDLIERILKDGRFGMTRAEMEGLLSADRFTGMAERQAEEYANKILDRFGGERTSEEAEINV
ncbi:MAG TPA: adenylosuccinate lyase [Candidatus Atribacteria bacterium]|nr:adenylosuccinate lyase [Candidatus Atribacteria bacterium]